VAFDVFAPDENAIAGNRSLCDPGVHGLAFRGYRQEARLADTHREQIESHALFRSLAVRSIAELSLAMISSTSPSLTTSGGASTIVSRMARQMSPSLKQ